MVEVAVIGIQIAVREKRDRAVAGIARAVNDLYVHWVVTTQ